MDYKNKERVSELVSSIEVIEKDLDKVNRIGNDAYYSFSLKVYGSSKDDFDFTTIPVDKDLEKIIKDYIVGKFQEKKQKYIEQLKNL